MSKPKRFRKLYLRLTLSHRLTPMTPSPRLTLMTPSHRLTPTSYCPNQSPRRRCSCHHHGFPLGRNIVKLQVLSHCKPTPSPQRSALNSFQRIHPPTPR